MGELNHVLAMYDVRGIQDYIFRTSDLKHAIGASAIVETIIGDALLDAVTNSGKDVSYDLMWELREYDGAEKDVQVLYIGGGNAFVLFKSPELYLDITRAMSRYVLRNTYSLQLAATYVSKTGNYSDDYGRLNIKMTRVKADMAESRPIGALPVMRAELATGLPVAGTENGPGCPEGDGLSMETLLKETAERKKRAHIDSRSKKFDNFIEQKGEDSTIAVIHIDGNNMGLRIRKLIEGVTAFSSALMMKDGACFRTIQKNS